MPCLLPLGDIRPKAGPEQNSPTWLWKSRRRKISQKTITPKEGALIKPRNRVWDEWTIQVAGTKWELCCPDKWCPKSEGQLEREREAMVQSEEGGGELDRVWKTGPVSLTRVYVSLRSWDQLVERSGTKGISANILDGD